MLAAWLQQLTKIDENKNLGDYIESASEILKSIDSLTDKETLAQSKKSYNDFKRPLATAMI